MLPRYNKRTIKIEGGFLGDVYFIVSMKSFKAFHKKDSYEKEFLSCCSFIDPQILFEKYFNSFCDYFSTLESDNPDILKTFMVSMIQDIIPAIVKNSPRENKCFESYAVLIPLWILSALPASAIDEYSPIKECTVVPNDLFDHQMNERRIFFDVQKNIHEFDQNDLLNKLLAKVKENEKLFIDFFRWHSEINKNLHDALLKDGFLPSPPL